MESGAVSGCAAKNFMPLEAAESIWEHQMSALWSTGAPRFTSCTVRKERNCGSMYDVMSRFHTYSVTFRQANGSLAFECGKISV